MQLFLNTELDNSFKQFFFTPEESRHIVKVLRKVAGDKLEITNGRGSVFTAKILLADPKKCKAQIESEEKKSPGKGKGRGKGRMPRKPPPPLPT